MKFLVDECAGQSVTQWLRKNGYDALSISEEMAGATDDQVLEMAFKTDRILITNDKDFGEMIFRHNKPHRGIVLLRLEDERPANKIAYLESLLNGHLADLENNFVVATEKIVRIIRVRN